MLVSHLVPSQGLAGLPMGEKIRIEVFANCGTSKDGDVWGQHAEVGN